MRDIKNVLLRTGILLLCLPACWHGAAAQTELISGGASSPQGKNQVSLYISLHDKKDRPLTDLKASDLAITDAGRAVDSSELRIDQDAAAGDHVITLLFDNMNAAGTANAVRAARNILKNIPEHEFPIAVWVVTDRLRVVQGYTRDRRLIERAIDEFAVGPVAVAAAGTEQEKLLAAQNAGDADTRTTQQKAWDRSSILALNKATQVVSEQHSRREIASLFAAAEAQRPLAGRKAILYFSQSVPADLKASEEFRAVSQSLKDASVSVYAVDLNAMDSNVVDGMEVAAAMGAPNIANAVAAAKSSSPAGVMIGPLGFKAIQDTATGLEFGGMTTDKGPLAQLSLSTGGAYTNADANSKKICRRVIADLTDYYTITYPEKTRYDGRFHTVSVNVLHARAALNTEAGYFAVRRNDLSGNLSVVPSPMANPKDENFSMGSMSEGASGADLSLKAAMLRFGKVSGSIHSVLAIEIPIQQLEMREDPNTALFALHVTVAAELKDSAGTTVARFHEEFRRHGSSAWAARERTRFISLDRTVNLPAGQYQMEAVVRDWNADTMGKSSETIQMADSDNAAALSDLVLVRTTEAKTGEDATEPLPYGQSYVVPNLSGELTGETRAASLYFQLYPDEKKGEAETLRLEVSKDGKLLATLPMHSQPVHANEVSSRVANVTLGGGSGAYELTLCLERGGVTTRRQISVASEENEAAHEELAKDEPPSIELDLKTTTSKQLAPQESTVLVTDARERALAYTHSLPNFMCVESIDRSYDPKGSGVWKHRDSIVELLRYVDKNETRTVLEVNGKKSHIAAESIQGARSNGEFGGILGIIFDPDSKAAFEWQKTDEKDGQVLQVYSYKVDAAKSQFFLTDHSGSEIRAPFHGLVLIDNDTRAVRRLIAQTDELPKSFGIKASWMSVDYDYIAINGHDYLLPTSGEVGLQEGRSMAISNQLRFSNYRRFGSHARILSNGPITDKPLQ